MEKYRRTVQESRSCRRRGNAPRGASRTRKHYVGRYPFELRVKAVRLLLDEKYSQRMVAAELGVGISTLGAWLQRYREEGENGLRDRVRQVRRKNKLPGAVRDKIVELKTTNPRFGVKRISQCLSRLFLLPGSPETVQKTLVKEGLNDSPTRRRTRRTPAKPRFFERATPNQMWQSDIFTFRLAGHNAYLIGYIDDYSRFITGMGIFRSQTAEHVIEVYRVATAEYGVPKEMLTDNGRQYTNWRGKTRFEKEMQKDRVKHFRSRPHHPMTLGKIERFWKSIWTEFLGRAQFDTFEEAQQRLALWLKYYNFRRPHQGIGGLCPADRFFEVHHELRQVINRGIADNVLEMALRGEPRAPFYMVGRLDGQSVVMHAEKGTLKLSVDGDHNGESRELSYHLNAGDHDNETTSEETETGIGPVQRCAEMPDSIERMDGSPDSDGGLPGTLNQLGNIQHVAESGIGGYAQGVGAEADRRCDHGAVKQETGNSVSEKSATIPSARPGTESTPGEAAQGAQKPIRRLKCAWECALERSTHEHQGGVGPSAGGSHHAGTTARTDRDTGSCNPRGVTQDILPVGEPGFDQYGRGTDQWVSGPTTQTG